MNDLDFPSMRLSAIGREASISIPANSDVLQGYFNQIMSRTIDLARQALTKGELPIAAVLADGDVILHEGHNEVTGTKYLTAHAETRVLHSAKDLLRGMKLVERNRLTLYSTLEPCLMCYGMAMTCNIGTVCFALESPGDGVLAIIHALKKESEQLSFYRAPKTIGGILRAESAALFRDFTLLYPGSPFAKWAHQLSSAGKNTPPTIFIA